MKNLKKVVALNVIEIDALFEIVNREIDDRDGGGFNETDFCMAELATQRYRNRRVNLVLGHQSGGKVFLVYPPIFIG